MTDWYVPDVYGHIASVSNISVLGWATDSQGYIVALSIHGNSLALKSIIAKAKIGEQIHFNPTDEYKIYGRTKDQIYTTFPKKPIVMEDGNVSQMLIRIPDEHYKYICYIEDDNANTRFYEALKLITDFPIHISWVSWLKSVAVGKSMWGVCNTNAKLRDIKPRLADIGQSRYGMNMRWLHNDRRNWESLIIEGVTLGNIKLPTEGTNDG